MPRSISPIRIVRNLSVTIFAMLLAASAAFAQDVTTTTLTAPTAATLGASATLVATVADTTTPANTPTGSVSFFDNNILIGSAALNAGTPDTATFTTSVLAVGSHSITATYISSNPGAGGFSNSSTTAASMQTINARTTTTTIVLNTPTVTVRNPGTSTVNATVADASGNNSGTFAFNNGDAGPAPCTPTGDCLGTPRQQAAASLLPNGTVLIVGGLDNTSTPLSSAEIFTSSALTGGSFAGAGVSMTTARVGATATLLQNGQVLIVGGSTTNAPTGAVASAEIYDPTTNTFTALTNSLNTARSGHTATLLSNGSVLIVGGDDSTGAPLTSTELFSFTTNPATDGTFAPGIPALTTARYQHTATLLPNGLILIAGGETSDAHTELLNPANATTVQSTTTANGDMATPLQGQVAALLPDGNVLIAGGETTAGTASTTTTALELYDQYAGIFVSVTPTLAQTTGRYTATATLLNNATVLVTGGADNTPTVLGTAEIYSPSYDPQGTVSLSSDQVAGVDSFSSCNLTLNSTGTTTCNSAEVTAIHFGTGTHMITGTYVGDWAANTTFGLNAFIVPLNATDNAGGFLYQATAGTSGGTEPNPFNQTIFGTTTDGSVTWTNVGLSNHATGQASTPQTLTVQQEAITITAVSVSKQYDGTTTASGTPTITGALLGSDTFSTPLTQQFVSAHVMGLNGSILTPVTPIVINDPTDGTNSTTNNDYIITDTGATAQASGTITPAPLTITANSGQSKVYGQADPPFTFTALGFQGGDTAATVLTGALSRAPGETVAASPYIILQGTLASNTDYSIATFNGANFNITPATLTITANAGQHKVYGQADPVFTFASSGFQFTDTAATVLTGALTRAAGETVAGSPYAITQGTLAANTNYTISFTGANFNITPATLTITANAGQHKVYGQADPVFTFASSGFQFTDTAATVLTGALSRTAGENVAGSPYAITQGTLAANTNYTISFTSAGFNITPATLTITTNAGQQKVYGQADPVFTFASSGFQFTDTAATVLTGALARTAGETVAGSPYAISQGTLASNTNYTISFTGANFNITPATLTVTAVAKTKVYGQADPALTFNSSGFQFTDTAATVLTGALTRAAGETVAGSPYAISQGTLASNTNYTISFTGANFTITPATLTITATAGLHKVYGQSDPVFTFASSGFQFTDTAATVLTGALSRTAGENVAGSPYAITQGTLAANTNYTISFTSAGFNITPATLTITTNAGQQKVYGQADPVFTFASSGFQFTDTAATVLTGALARTAGETVAGSPYAISQGTLASNTNYTISFTGANFNITPATLTVTAVAKTKVYGQADPALTFNSSGFQFTDTAATVLTGALTRAAGETVAGSPYAITQGTLAANTNYTISYTGANFTITAATLTVTAVANTKVYGSADPALTFNSSGFQFTDTAATVLTGNVARVAGETVAGSPYAINQGTLAANTNYSISFTSANFTITPAPLSITAKNLSKSYGQTLNFAGTEFTVSAGTLFNGDTVNTVTLVSAGAAQSATLAGSPYSITASAAAGPGVGNYSISYLPGTLQVNPALLTITANTQQKTYGSALNFTGTEFSQTGLIAANGDSITSITLASGGSPTTATVAGSPYTITASTAVGSGLTNYTIVYNNSTLTVSPAPLTITANNIAKTYGATVTLGSGQTGFAITSGTFFNGDTATSVTLSSAGGVASASVGSYPVTPSASVGSGLANYNVLYANGSLTISTAPLSVTPSNQSSVYGAPLPVLTGTVATLVAGDQITGQYTTTATAASNVGSYPITVAGLNDPAGRAGNYVITNNTGMLTVGPANSQVGTVSISAVANATGTPQFTVSASVANATAGSAGNPPAGNLIFQDCVGAACTQLVKVPLAAGVATTTTVTVASNASPHAIMVSYDQGDANYAAPAKTGGNATGLAVLTTISTTAGAVIPTQTVPILNPTGSSGAVSYNNISCAITSGGFPVANTICNPSATAINNLAVGTTFSLSLSLATHGASAQPAGTQAKLHLHGLESLSLVLPAILILPLGMSAETRRKLLRRRALTWLAIGLVLALMMMASSCGGGGFSNPNSLLPNSGASSATPVGSYIVQVTGTNQSGQSVAMASIPLTVGF